MIALPTEVFVATAPVDLRYSFDRLAGLVRERIGEEPKRPAVFVFHNRARTHLKVLWHDGRGYCVFYKRLDRGTYRIPLSVAPQATHVRMTARELALLLRGIDEAILAAARRSVALMTAKSPTNVHV